MIHIENLVKRYGDLVALDHLNLDIEEGEIFGLLGPNGSGKTTAISCLLALLKYDRGTITIFGKNMRPDSYDIKKDIGVVMQNVAVFEQMSVRENIDYFCGLYISDKAKRKTLVDEAIAFTGLEDFEKMRPKKLSGGLLRRLNIACGIVHKPKLIIMDEPTTALNNQEIDNLFTIMRRLKGQGVSFIYISHKMPEIFTICDKYTVLRDGKFIETGFIKDINEHQATELLIGKTFVNANLKEQQEPCMEEEVVLSVSGLTGETFEDITFDLHKGEVIAITGLQGAGSGELATALFGATPSKSGTVTTRNGKLNTRSILDVMRHRVAMIPCNRKERGILPDLSIRDNNSMAYFTLLHKKCVISNKEENDRFEKNRSKMEIKVGSEKDPITSLSGGNQQKVIVGRWLETDADVMIMDNPTQGIDVGAKYAIYKLILELASQGKGILVFSTEFPEIYQIADRCIVMYKGKINGILEREELNEAGVMALSTGTKTEVQA